MKKGSVGTLLDLKNEVMRQRELKKDILVNTQCLEYSVDDAIQQMSVIDRERDQQLLQMPVNDIAHRQLGTYLDIPAKYYDTMRKENPELLAVNINSWLQRRKSQQRMIRLMDGRMRAFLSNSYRKMDNDMILYTVLPILEELGLDAQVESCEVTERKMYIKVVNKRIQAEVAPNDIVNSGVVISNSEIGMGSVTVQPLIYRLVCLNGMVVNDAVTRTHHKGARMVSNNDLTFFKEDTLAAQAEALRLEIRDSVEDAISQVTVDRVAQRYRLAQKTEITGNIPALVTVAAQDFKLTQDERDGVLEHLYQGNDYTLYGFSNAITRMSQNVDDYDRATELESVGYDVLTMPRVQWEKLNTVKEAQAIAA